MKKIKWYTGKWDYVKSELVNRLKHSGLIIEVYETKERENIYRLTRVSK